MKYILSTFVVFFLFLQTSFAEVGAIPTQTESGITVSTYKAEDSEKKEVLSEAIDTNLKDETVETPTETMGTAETITASTQEGTIPTLDVDTLKNATYTYYYGDGCSHCADLDTFLNKFGGYETLNITKKEIWYNKENQKEFLAEAKRLLGDDANKAGTPFWIVKTGETEFPLIGTDSVQSFIKPALGNEPTETYKEKVAAQQTGKYMTLGLLILIAIGLPAGLYFLGRGK